MDGDYAHCAVLIQAMNVSADQLIITCHRQLAACWPAGVGKAPSVRGALLDTRVRSVIVTSAAYRRDRVIRDALFGATHALLVTFPRTCGYDVSTAIAGLAEQFPLHRLCGRAADCVRTAIDPAA